MSAHKAYPMFDLKQAEVPDDLCPVATDISPMLPGDWRSMRPVVNRDKCVKCAVCWLYCPVQCVEEKPRWFDFNLKTCKGCGICVAECPCGAIRMEAQEKKNSEAAAKFMAALSGADTLGLARGE